jgi:hypothetical protein
MINALHLAVGELPSTLSDYVDVGDADFLDIDKIDVAGM